MALTRKFLQAMSIDEEKIDEIISAHSETVTALKEQRDSYKADAEKLPTVEKELNELKQTAGGDNPFEKQYNDLKAEYDSYKATIEAEKVKDKKAQAVKSLLKEINIGDKWVDRIVNFTNFDDIELDGDNLKNADGLKERYTKDYSDCIVKTQTEGVNTETPPQTSPQVDYDKLSDEEYYKTIFKKGD